MHALTDHPRYRIVTSVGAVVFALVTCAFVALAMKELERPQERVTIDYRLGVDGDALERTRLVLHTRLVALNAAHIVSSVHTDGVRLEFQPPPRRQSEAQLDHESTRVDPELLMRLGTREPFEMLVLADIAAVVRLGSSISEEARRLESWRSAHPKSSIQEFHSLARADGGPVSGLRWYPQSRPPESTEPEFVPLVVPPSEWTFVSRDVTVLEPFGSSNGWAAMVSLRPPRDSAFGDYTESAIGQSLACVVAGRVESKQRIPVRWPDQTLIAVHVGARPRAEVDALSGLVRSGELPGDVEMRSATSTPAPWSRSLVVVVAPAILAGCLALALLVAFLRSERLTSDDLATSGVNA